VGNSPGDALGSPTVAPPDGGDPTVGGIEADRSPEAPGALRYFSVEIMMIS